MSSDHHLDVLGPLRSRSRRLAAVMWAAIALCAGLVVVLLLTGLGEDAWAIGVLALMLSCLGVCVWAEITSQRDIDEAVEDARRFVAERNAADEARWSRRRPD